MKRRTSRSPFTAEAGPLGEDGERQYLRVGEQSRTARATPLWAGLAAIDLPPVVYVDVQ